MEELGSAQVSVEAGIVGDRRGKQVGRQVSLLSEEAWEAACKESGGALPWITRRANVLVSGMDFNEATGQEYRIGEVHLKVTEETDPCSMMEAAQSGLRDAMSKQWRGGARCTVLRGGDIAVGDVFEVLE
jgi:MOSC domain-containing protein YiiM